MTSSVFAPEAPEAAETAETAAITETTNASPAVRAPWAGAATATEREQWIAVAEQVADRLAEDAIERDRAGSLPVEPLRLLRESGLANLLVPVEFGGHGAHWETAFAAVRVLARVDASVAQLLGYSYLNQACIVFYNPDPERQAEWYRRSAEGSWLWADSFNPVSPDLSLVADGADYRLTGLKRFATGAAVADVIIAGAIAEGGDLDGELVVFALDSTRGGVVHVDDWDNIGYRASASGSVRYDNVRVSTADIIGFDRDEPFSSVVTPGVQLLFGNVYLGIAEGALAQGRELILARPNSWFLSGVERYADDPITHRAIGELVASTAAVEALADRLNARYDEAVARGADTTAQDRAELEIAVAQLKVVSTEVSLNVSNRIFELTGASSTRSSTGLDLHWRDIRTHSLHDPVDYKRIEVGAHYLTGAVQPISLYT